MLYNIIKFGIMNDFNFDNKCAYIVKKKHMHM